MSKDEALRKYQLFYSNFHVDDKVKVNQLTYDSDLHCHTYLGRFAAQLSPFQASQSVEGHIKYYLVQTLQKKFLDQC